MSSAAAAQKPSGSVSERVNRLWYVLAMSVGPSRGLLRSGDRRASRIHDAGAVRSGERRQVMRLAAAIENVPYGIGAHGERVRQELPMAPPRHGFGAHHRDPP